MSFGLMNHHHKLDVVSFACNRLTCRSLKLVLRTVTDKKCSIRTLDMSANCIVLSEFVGEEFTILMNLPMGMDHIIVDNNPSLKNDLRNFLQIFYQRKFGLTTAHALQTNYVDATERNPLVPS
eukprot:PhF_6_TR38872/c0_g1_i1/m.58135